MEQQFDVSNVLQGGSSKVRKTADSRASQSRIIGSESKEGPSVEITKEEKSNTNYIHVEVDVPVPENGSFSLKIGHK